MTEQPTEQHTDSPDTEKRLGLPQRSPRTRRVRSAAPRDATEYQPDADTLALARRIVDLAEDKKASDIVLLEIGRLTSMADYFVICSGASERQLGGIADGIAEGLRAEGVRPIGREGPSGAHWILLDFGSVVVHVMAQPERDFYQLERLWAEAPPLLRLQ